MFGKKAKRLQELERKIEGYLFREHKLRKLLVEKDKKIQYLGEELQNYEKETEKVQTLKEIRTEKKMTQEEVAKKIGVKSFSYISAMERGAVIPNIKMIYKLADVYDRTPRQIFESVTKDGWGYSDGK